MRLRCLIFVSTALLLIIAGAKATYNYSILVGAHEVAFNTSSSFFENIAYKTSYSPVLPGWYGEYTSSSTDLLYSDVTWGDYPDIYRSDLPFLTITIRDFKTHMPWIAQVLEVETRDKFALFTKVPRGTTYSGGSYHVVNHTNEYTNRIETLGVIVEWPKDNIEIVITGSLLDFDIWSDIARSIVLVR